MRSLRTVIVGLALSSGLHAFAQPLPIAYIERFDNLPAVDLQLEDGNGFAGQDTDSIGGLFTQLSAGPDRDVRLHSRNFVLDTIYTEEIVGPFNESDEFSFAVNISNFNAAASQNDGKLLIGFRDGGAGSNPTRNKFGVRFFDINSTTHIGIEIGDWTATLDFENNTALVPGTEAPSILFPASIRMDYDGAGNIALMAFDATDGGGSVLFDSGPVPLAGASGSSLASFSVDRLCIANDQVRTGGTNVFVADFDDIIIRGRVGACCLPAGCDIMTEHGCTAAGGDYRGEGSECFETACGAGPTPTPALASQREVTQPDRRHTFTPTAVKGGTEHIGPIYLFSGEFYLNVTDMRIRGRGTDFVWARKYGSITGPNTPQGNGWDCSYNIFLEQDGDNRLVHNGWTRTDTYPLDANSGTWRRPEFFRELTIEPDDSYTLTFPDTSRWHFLPLDASPQAGKISTITDRNNNTMTFAYDGAGRLQTVTDTLDRDIQIAYISGGPNDGMIQSVTDFTGRVVTYAYYDGIEPGGSVGDLKSVTTPAVTGTPNGNDFPNGKTTVYTYATGFAEERLNHNLLTITDPKGHLIFSNTYAPTTDDTALGFDRITRCIWGDQPAMGDAGDVMDVVYETVAPTPANGNAVLRTILNDRVGHVKEFLFDDRNRAVVSRSYTGAWDPDAPTTGAQLGSPDIAPLRPTDPPFFETTRAFNDNSLLTRIVHPNGNIEEFFYDDFNPDARARSNVLMHRRLPGTHTPPGDQAELVQTFEYDDGPGGTNFITRQVDARGNDTAHTYDASGNRTQTTHRIPSIVEDFSYNAFGQRTKHIHPDNGTGCRRVDVFTYYDTGPQRGYLHEQIIDATDPDACPGSHFDLTTTYEYDDRGNVVRTTDPRGNATDLSVNQLDRVVRTTQRPIDTINGTVRYEVDTFYDANDNVVRVDTQNIDGEGNLVAANTHFTVVNEYDALNHLVRTCYEAGTYDGAIPGSDQLPLCDDGTTALPESEFITTEFEYDANRNRTLIRHGEATEGRQPGNTERTIYDERDLVFGTIRAGGTSLVSSTQYDYDGNGNLVTTTSGIEAATSPAYPGDAPRVTTSTYDGYNRLVATVDPMGNLTEYHLDPNGNIGGEVDPLILGNTLHPFGVRHNGELIDGPGNAANVRLSESLTEYDAMDRIVRTTTQFFDAATQTAILVGVTPDGVCTTDTLWSDNSQVLRTTDDNLHETNYTYDTANRLDTTTDAAGNTTRHIYDANSNVVTLEETELSDGGAPAQQFTTTFTHDALDRLTSTTDNLGNTTIGAVGNTTTLEYDSRGNATRSVDALGNETMRIYDGINRLIRTVRDLDGTGADAAAMPGDGNPDIVTAQQWDDSSRVIARADDNDNTTSYTYDELNRLTNTTHADTTQVGTMHDVHGNVIATLDANDSLVSSAYDLLNRPIERLITPGASVSSATLAETFEYDGLSRIVRADDDDVSVTRTHDSLSHVTSETINGRTVTSVFDCVGNQLQCTYPGGRQISCEFDALDRKQTIYDGPDNTAPVIATYEYIGPSRVERRTLANGTDTTFTYNGITGVPNPPNDFGVRRLVRTTHSLSGSTVDDRTYTWDRVGNKTSREDVRPSGPRLRHAYSYDRIYRLTQTLVTDETAPASPVTVRETMYSLDGVDNRLSVTDPNAGGQYELDATTPQPADRQMNQYSATSFDRRQYDENGNLIAVVCLCDTDGAAGTTIIDLLAFIQLWFAGDPGAEFTGDDPPMIDVGDLLAFLSCWFPASDGNCPEPERTIEYDYADRMVRHTSTDVTTEYRYDALGRRIAKIVDVSGAPSETRYSYDGPHVCEERNGDDLTTATYIYGAHVGDPIQMRRAGTDFYYHTDDIDSVFALSDIIGNVLERYEYHDYGEHLDPQTGGALATEASSLGNPYRFKARRFDRESRLHHLREHVDDLWHTPFYWKYADSTTGRSTTRHDAGKWHKASARRNGYALGVSNPMSSVETQTVADRRRGAKTPHQTRRKKFEREHLSAVAMSGQAANLGSRERWFHPHIYGSRQTVVVYQGGWLVVDSGLPNGSNHNGYNHFARHQNYYMKDQPNDNSELFGADAMYDMGLLPTGPTWESHDYVAKTGATVSTNTNSGFSTLTNTIALQSRARDHLMFLAADLKQNTPQADAEPDGILGGNNVTNPFGLATNDNGIVYVSSKGNEDIEPVFESDN